MGNKHKDRIKRWYHVKRGKPRAQTRQTMGMVEKATNPYTAKTPRTGLAAGSLPMRAPPRAKTLQAGQRATLPGAEQTETRRRPQSAQQAQKTPRQNWRDRSQRRHQICRGDTTEQRKQRPEVKGGCGENFDSDWEEERVRQLPLGLFPDSGL